MPTKSIFPSIQTIKEQDVPPTDTSKSNAVVVLSSNAAGDVVKIDKTINGVVYSKTISNTDEVIVSTKTISAWSEV